MKMETKSSVVNDFPIVFVGKTKDHNNKGCVEDNNKVSLSVKGELLY